MVQPQPEHTLSISATYLLSFPGIRSNAVREHRRLSRTSTCSSVAAVDTNWPDPLVAGIPTCIVPLVLLVLPCLPAAVARA